jgi:hypothetical protein
MLPIDDFSNNKNKIDGKQSYCRACKKLIDASYYSRNSESQVSRVQNRRRELREKIDFIKGKKGCCVCLEKEPCCLDFHHTNDDKEGNVSQMVFLSMKRAMKEIAKCVVICSNCHRKLHKGLISLPEKCV